MKSFVTGATGLLGVNLVRALRWEGHHVSALVPSGWHGPELSGDPGVEIVHGSEEHPNRWLSRATAADLLFHAAPPAPGVSVMNTGHDEWPAASFSTGAMLGPGNIMGSALGRWICEFLRTGTVGPAMGGTCIVDARDVALAMMAAADIRATGEFSVAGHYVQFRELLELLEDLTGRHSDPHGRVVLRATDPVSSARAVNELGIVFRPVEETLRDVVAWYLPRRTAGLVA